MTKRTPTLTPKAERLINRVLVRAEDYAYLGAAHPDEHKAIVAGYQRALFDLKTYIESLEKRPATVKSDVMPDA
jgi:hypothetical protein